MNPFASRSLTSALSLVSVASVVSLASLPSAASAQDQFGRVVSVGDGEVFVMKPSAGRGPATVFVYARTPEGGWDVRHQLHPVGGIATGEGFSPSLAYAPGRLLVGGGDAEAVRGVLTYREMDDTEWTVDAPFLLAPSTRSPDAAFDMAALMRIMQPPPRTVTVDDNRAAVVAVGGTGALSGVRVLAMTAGEWVEIARIEPPQAESRLRFGTALALRGGRLAVGAPGDGATGRVHLFAANSGEASAWRAAGTMAPTDTSVTQFGQAILFDGETLLVGAPGADAVLRFAPNAAGDWVEAGRLTPPVADGRTAFGYAMALDGNELWVGAPRAHGSGAVYRFLRGDDGVWNPADAPAVSGREPGFAFGISVALRGNIAAVGAPGADGAGGRAAAFSRPRRGAWEEGTWLRPEGAPTLVTGGEVACDDGKAGQFECSDVDLLAFLPLDALGADPGERVSDVWGWTDPVTSREFALVGRTAGAAFVDVTNPSSPVLMGLLPANRSGARDLKVYKDHLFFTGDGAGNHGLIVFDLARLRDVRMPPVTFEPDARYEGIASAHNLVIDTDAGFAFPVGASGGGETCGGGLHMIDIRDPVNPTFAGCYTDTEGLIWPGRTHDAQCVVYRGPDQRYHERQICFASNETALRIVDVTDKEHPTPIAAATYPGIAYVHQGWLTEDQRYFYLDDELDELVGKTDRTRTMVWDVAELDDPVLVGEFLGPNGSTDHNLYVKGNRMYQANYQAGLRVIDISDPEHPVEVGHFDTTPYEGDPPGFNGAWTAYPYFASGTVIVTSMNEGLFVLRPRVPALVP